MEQDPYKLAKAIVGDMVSNRTPSADEILACELLRKAEEKEPIMVLGEDLKAALQMLKDISFQTDQDGVWLRFKNGTKEAAFNLGAEVKGSFISTQLAEFASRVNTMRTKIEEHEKRGVDLQPESRKGDLAYLQYILPWTIHYNRDFRASPMRHKDFGHALLHVTKASGKIATAINDAEHGGTNWEDPKLDDYIADLVICALRMANTVPGRKINLSEAVVRRIENKNQVEI